MFVESFRAKVKESSDGKWTSGNLSLRLLDSLEHVTDDSDDVSHNNLPIVCVDKHEHFDHKAYFSNLKTSQLGRCVVFCDVITSSMPLISM